MLFRVGVHVYFYFFKNCIILLCVYYLIKCKLIPSIIASVAEIGAGFSANDYSLFCF